MKRKVELNILAAESTGVVTEDVHIHGRLLGVISGLEGTKVIQNQEIAQRIATAEAVTLTDTLKGLETIKKENSGRDGFGRLVVAISSMRTEKEKEMNSVLTRQLFISTGISLISETAKKDKDLMRATFTCTDDSIIMINEKEITNE